MSATTVTIDQLTQDYIVGERNKKCTPDTIAQLLVLTLRAKTPEQAEQMVTEVIGTQSSAKEPAQTKQSTPAPAEQSTPQTPQSEPAQQTATGGNVSADERSECERACPTPTLCNIAQGSETQSVSAPVEPVESTPPAADAAGQTIGSALPGISQPDAKGEFASPLDGALAMVARGIPVTPLHPRTKIAFKNDWQQSATTDENQIQAWSTETPNANWACVAKAQPGGTWFFEIDRDGLIQRIEAETGHKFPKTLRIRSRDGRGHIYFQHNAASIALSNGKAYISIKDAQGELCSARLNNSYVVAPNSIHPDTGKPYQVLSKPDQELVEAPGWLIEWIGTQHTESEKATKPAPTQGVITEGGRNNYLTRRAGELRAKGCSEEVILVDLTEQNEQLCQPTLPESEVKTIAHSIGTRPTNHIPTFNSQPTAPLAPTPEINVVPYPEFPSWVYTTPSPVTGRRPSIYEGLVKPWCDANSRYEAFMLLPAYTLLLTYLGTKVHIRDKSYPLSLYVVLIGPKGKVIKSSSAESALTYFRLMGFLEDGNSNTRTADSRIVVWTPGSSEGLGVAICKSNCKNPVLYYDELSKLDKKSQIECSSLGSDLVTGYESGKLQNLVKRQKESYAVEAGTYVMSFIACTTDKNFNEQWSRLCTGNDGLDDRAVFLIPPEQLKPLTPMIDVDTVQGAIETKKLIDKAVLQGTFEIHDDDLLDDPNELLRQSIVEGFGNRDEIRAEKLALAFAVDMDLDHIDADCVRRALAVCHWTIGVKRLLKTMDARDRVASAQQKIRRLLARRKAGRMLKTELLRQAESDQWSTPTWRVIYNGLIQENYIREDIEDGKTYVQLLVELQEAL